ncbi:MAG: divalent-cation tolerance protein CutA [Acidobacteriota bacterium]
MSRVLFSTIDGKENALHLARQLTEERLAACVSIIPNVKSVYKWKGVTEEADEYLLIIKTARDRVSAAIERIAQLHPYEVPEVVSLAVEEGFPPT